MILTIGKALCLIYGVYVYLFLLLSLCKMNRILLLMILAAKNAFGLKIQNIAAVVYFLL